MPTWRNSLKVNSSPTLGRRPEMVWKRQQVGAVGFGGEHRRWSRHGERMEAVVSKCPGLLRRLRGASGRTPCASEPHPLAAGIRRGQSGGRRSAATFGATWTDSNSCSQDGWSTRVQGVCERRPRRPRTRVYIGQLGTKRMGYPSQRSPAACPFTCWTPGLTCVSFS